MFETPKENSPYQQYLECGGIINEKDYESALARARNAMTAPDTPEKELGKEPGNMAKFAGIELHDTEDALDQRTVLYRILRADAKPKEVKYHHSQMSDQRLFAEVLRMLHDEDALKKLIAAYHKVGIHCPICLKTPAAGEECR